MSRGKKIKEIDEFPRRIKIFAMIISGMIIFGMVAFTLLTGSNLDDSLLRTLQTLAFMFAEDSSVIERLLEIFLAIVGVFLVWWVLWSVADMLLDGNLQKYLKIKMYTFRMDTLINHIIIIGGGRVGSEVAFNLSNEKKSFIIIENDKLVITNLRKKNYLVVEGNAEDESVLSEAGVERASKMVLTLPKTEANLLITLTSKEMNPKIDIYARATEQKFVSKLKKAGAKMVIVPEIVAGDKITELINMS